MVSRPVVLGLIGVFAILVALVLNFWVLPGDDADVAVVQQPAPAVPSQPTVPPAQPGAPQAASPQQSTTASSASDPAASGAGASQQGAATGSTAETGTVEPTDTKPSFDIVRVDPEGNTVIAGRSEPNAEVTILDGDTEIGRVQSDERGEWVFVPTEKLPPGERILTLRQGDDESAEARASDEAIVLVVPEPGKDIAGRDSSESETPLALVVPRDEAARRTVTPRVLQAPAAGPVATPAAPATDQADTAPVIQAYPEKADTAQTQTADGSDVTVDIIEYDDKGEVVFGGKTEPNAEVEVFIDEKTVGRATADAEGRWQMRPSTPVAPGNYNLRVDKVDPAGQVKARVALPFVRAAPLAELPADRLVVIQPGNNLWRIATRVYGQGTRYIQIHDANRDQIKDPDLIYPGQIFGLPRVN